MMRVGAEKGEKKKASEIVMVLLETDGKPSVPPSVRQANL